MRILTAVFILGIALGASSAYAETVRGRVTSVNTDTQSFTIAPRERAAKFPEAMPYSVPRTADLRGIDSLNDLAVGDEIRIEGDKKPNGFEVRSLQKTLSAPGVYTWKNKLKRGALNIVSSPVEVARSITLGSHDVNLAYGWTVGLVRGVGQGFVRMGAGFIDLVTFPFDFPNHGKAPLIQPEYVWQKPGLRYS